LATVILEVLAGVRSPTDAAKTLEISLSRYYLLEQRAGRIARGLRTAHARTEAKKRQTTRRKKGS
jgi:hypothetical protein